MSRPRLVKTLSNDKFDVDIYTYDDKHFVVIGDRADDAGLTVDSLEAAEAVAREALDRDGIVNLNAY